MNEQFMREAIQLSVDNVKSGRGGPFGAVIAKDGRIVATGVNMVTSTNDPTAHAEVVAIRNACKMLRSFQLTECELYTSCEPCPMCLGAIYWARPSRVYYGASRHDAAAIGFDDALIYEEIDKHLVDRRLPFQQLLPEEAQAGFRAWQEWESRIRY